MRSIGVTQIVLLVLFIVVPIINYILARKERERKRRMESRRSATQPVEVPARRPAQRQSTVAPEFVASRTAAPPQPSVRPRDVRSRQALFRTKRDLRRTIIAMTILGPCRADDPPN
jgi:hypothetical protein